MEIEDNARLIQGLRKLNKADPSLEVYAQENGEIVVGTCGEVHLERCITDLQYYFKLRVVISEPIVSFKETIIYSNLFEESKQKINKKKSKIMNAPTAKAKARKEKNMQDDLEVETELKKKKQVLEDEETEVMNSYDIDETDIRYSQFTKKEEDKLKKWKYTQQFENTKKTDHKNRNKVNKFSLLELQEKSNVAQDITSNQKIAIRVRAVGIPF